MEENIEKVESEVVETPEVKTEEVVEEKDWKAEAAKWQAIANRKAKHAETEAKPEKKEGETLGYGEKAYLIANGIKNDEIALVEEAVKNTGKSIEEVLESKHFQIFLKDFRDTKVQKEAVAPGTKRTGQAARDSVEYWIAKGELPPADQTELRRKVVNAKTKSASSGNKFTNNPVV